MLRFLTPDHALCPAPWLQTDYWRFEVMNVPLLAVGDYYYHVATRDMLAFVFLADVSGGGLLGAMFSATLKVLCEEALPEGRDPRDVLGRFNEALYPLCADDISCTAWLGTFDGTGMVRYSSAGHEPALVRTKDGALHQLEGGGLPLGAQREHFATQTIAHLASGDSILLYSDGMAELLDRKGLAIEELFENFDRMREQLPMLDRRDDTMALLATCCAPTTAEGRSGGLTSFSEHFEG